MAHKIAKRATKNRAVTEHQPHAEEHTEERAATEKGLAKGTPPAPEAQQGGLTALAARVAALEQRAGVVPAVAVDPTQGIRNARLPNQGAGGPVTGSPDVQTVR